MKNCIDEVTQLMKQWHELANAKESISYGLQPSKFPFWIVIQNGNFELNCDVHLATTDQDQFAIFLNEISNSAVRALAAKTIQCLNEHISDKQSEIANVSCITAKTLGVANET